MILFDYNAPSKAGEAVITVSLNSSNEMIVGSPLVVRIYLEKTRHDWASLSPGAIMLVVILSVFGFVLLAGACFLLVGQIVEHRHRFIYRYRGGGKSGLSIIMEDSDT